jgi:hypothetical protein
MNRNIEALFRIPCSFNGRKSCVPLRHQKSAIYGPGESCIQEGTNYCFRSWVRSLEVLSTAFLSVSETIRQVDATYQERVLQVSLHCPHQFTDWLPACLPHFQKKEIILHLSVCVSAFMSPLQAICPPPLNQMKVRLTRNNALDLSGLPASILWKDHTE